MVHQVTWGRGERNEAPGPLVGNPIRRLCVTQRQEEVMNTASARPRALR